MATVKPPCDDGVVQGAGPATPCPPASGPWILAATILGSSMAFIDGTVVNVALPVLQTELHASVADVQWVIEAYSLFLSALILVGGSLGDRYGRRLIFALGITLFTLASVGCGLAQSTSQLIASRAIQGIGGAMLVPGSLAIISASFSEDQRGKAIGTWSGFSAITGAAGPLVGGFLIQQISWRAVFFVNVPFAAAVLAILFRHVPESRDPARARLDWAGAVLATLGLGGIVYGLIQSSVSGFGDASVIAALAGGVVLLIAFVLAERRSPAPMMPLDLFRSRTFSGVNLLTLLLYGALGASTFFFPFNFIRVQGYSPTAAGAAFLPFILIMFVGSRWTGGFVARFGAKRPLVVGPLITAAGLALLARPGVGGSYWTTFFPGIVVMGVGMTIAVAPLTTVVMSAVESRHAGVASGINNAAARAAGLLSIAALSIAVQQVFSRNLDSRLSSLKIATSLRNAVYAQRTRLTDIQIPSRTSAPLQAALHRAIDDAFVAGFRLAVLIASALALAGALAALLMVEGKHAGQTARQPETEDGRRAAVPAVPSHGRE
ncbi:MAG: MFS transporter [Chloroflexi bacterium]|nr:MFS transporter [Chloroflexota bacterium]